MSEDDLRIIVLSATEQERQRVKDWLNLLGRFTESPDHFNLDFEAIDAPALDTAKERLQSLKIQYM